MTLRDELVAAHLVRLEQKKARSRWNIRIRSQAGWELGTAYGIARAGAEMLLVEQAFAHPMPFNGPDRLLVELEPMPHELAGR